MLHCEEADVKSKNTRFSVEIRLKKMKNKLSRFILGTSHFGGYVNFKNAEKIILKSYKYGLRKIDTSPMYGENNAEKFIGLIRKKHNLKLKIFSKVGLEGFKKKISFTQKNYH